MCVGVRQILNNATQQLGDKLNAQRTIHINSGVDHLSKWSTSQILSSQQENRSGDITTFKSQSWQPESHIGPI